MIPTDTTRAKHPYYGTTTLCPFCSKLLPGEVYRRDEAVYLSRECPEHGHIEALVCSDINWFEGLKRFDVTPIKPAHPQYPVNQGCPLDCGLCAAHRQVAGTMAIEISNKCNADCPVCLGDNRGTFEMSVAEIRELVEGAIRDQGQIGVFTLSGGEPTIHPQFFEILSLLVYILGKPRGTMLKSPTKSSPKPSPKHKLKPKTCPPLLLRKDQVWDRACAQEPL